jgi:hypothetical protein
MMYNYRARTEVHEGHVITSFSNNYSGAANGMDEDECGQIT